MLSVHMLSDLIHSVKIRIIMQSVHSLSMDMLSLHTLSMDMLSLHMLMSLC